MCFFSFKNLKIFKLLFDIVLHIKTINPSTTILSIICLVYLVIFKEFINPKIKKKTKLEFPSELLLVRTFLF